MTRADVVIMAGGTGGHVFPALAVADVLRQRQQSVHWIGTQKGIESRLVPAANIPLHCLTTVGLRGKGWRHGLSSLWHLGRACLQARRLLQQLRPRVVLGMGGYASGPGALAAKSLGIPLVIHEQNARAGTTNRYLAKVANRIVTAFPDVLAGGVCIGNPVRAAIVALPEPKIRLADRQGPVRLLVLGGSLGAQAINEQVPEAVQPLVAQHHLQVRHQTGAAHCDKTLHLYQTLGVTAQVSAFIDDMAEALAWADLVVCRAGALTVSELSAAGVASVLIPFPHAIDDHQTANAEWLVRQGGALLRPQRDLNVASLRSLLEELIADRSRLLAMAQAARSAAKISAAEDCADVCLEVSLGQ